MSCTEGVEVRDVVAELEFNDCDAETSDCVGSCGVIMVEEAPDADPVEDGLPGVVDGCDVEEESVNDGAELASTVRTEKVLPWESTSIC